MWIALILTLVSAAYLVMLVLIATSLYKEPILHHFERYAEADDSYYLLPQLLFGSGLLAIFGGILFNAAFASRFPPFLFGALFILLAYLAREYRHYMRQYPQIFLSFPRWYVELRER